MQKLMITLPVNSMAAKNGRNVSTNASTKSSHPTTGEPNVPVASFVPPTSNPVTTASYTVWPLFAATNGAFLSKHSNQPMVHSPTSSTTLERCTCGDSEAYFQGSDADPKHGTVQGNGHGPPTYSCMSSPVFEMVRHESLTVSLASPITRQIFQYLG